MKIDEEQELLIRVDKKVRDGMEVIFENIWNVEDHILSLFNVAGCVFDKEMFEEFLNIYKETMTRDNAKDYYYFNEEFFNDIKLNMNNNAIIVTAYLNDTAIDSVLIIYNGDNAHYHLGGTLNNYMDLGAHNYVLYEAALLSLKKGFKNFHLGGGYGGDNSPLLRFKKNFNKNGGLDFYIGKKIYNQEKYDELVKIKESIKGSKIEDNFFPKYRSD